MWRGACEIDMMLYDAVRMESIVCRRCLNYFGIDGMMLQILEECACSRR